MNSFSLHMRHVFVHFLGEIEDTKKTFRNYLTFNKKVTIVPSAVSDIIKDKRTHEALKIVDFSESTAPTKGGKKIVIFTGKICKDDIEVHFSFENSEYNPK